MRIPTLFNVVSLPIAVKRFLKYGEGYWCGTYPSLSHSGQTVIDGFWDSRKWIVIPEQVQIDSAMSFFGSPIHPREIIFIAQKKREPYRFPFFFTF